MICQPIKYRYRIGLGLLSIVVVIGIYSWASLAQHKFNPHDTLMPNASQFLVGFNHMVTPDRRGHRWLIEDVLASAERFWMGMCAGITLSLFFGMLAGCFEWIAALTLPILSFVARIPPTAMLAIYFVAFGTGEALFTAIIAFGVFPLLTLSIYGAIKKDVNSELIYKTYTLGASNSETMFEAVFKQILPRIIQNIQIQIGPAMVFLIAAEFVMADVGIGYRLRMQSRLLNMNVVYLYLILLGTIGWIIDYVLVRIRRWLCPWFGE